MQSGQLIVITKHYNLEQLVGVILGKKGKVLVAIPSSAGCFKTISINREESHGKTGSKHSISRVLRH